MTKCQPTTARISLAFAVYLTIATVSSAADWPQWRGPDGTGVSTEKQPPIVWHVQRSIAWKTTMPGPAASTPAIWGDAIFVTAHTSEDKLLLLRLAKKDGQIAWTQEIGSGTQERQGPRRQPTKIHKFYSPAGPSPVTNGKVVVTHFGNGDLAAYDLEGKRLWKRNLQDDYGPYTSWYGHANSPVIAGNLVISVCMQDSLADLREVPIESYLVAHDLQTGEVRWRVTRMTKAEKEECDSYTTPLPCRLNGIEELVVMGANQLDAYEPATGKQLWLLPAQTGGRTVTGPTLARDMIVATRGLRGAMFAVSSINRAPEQRDVRRDVAQTRRTGPPSSQVPQNEPTTLTFRDIAWTYKEGAPDSCSPVAWNDLLFTITDDGIARCLDASTGNLKWKERLKGQYKASPIAADGRVFFLNTDGLTTIVSAAPRFDKLIENQLEDTTTASPALSDGKLFIRGHKTLYCIGR